MKKLNVNGKGLVFLEEFPRETYNETLLQLIEESAGEDLAELIREQFAKADEDRADHEQDLEELETELERMRDVKDMLMCNNAKLADLLQIYAAARKWDGKHRIKNALKDYLGVADDGDMLYRLMLSAVDDESPMKEVPVLFGPPACGKTRFLAALNLNERYSVYEAEGLQCAIPAISVANVEGLRGICITSNELPDINNEEVLKHITFAHCRPEMAKKKIEDLDAVQLWAELESRRIAEMEAANEQ